MQLNGDVIAAYLSSYGGVEDYMQIKSAHGTAYGDFLFTMILDRGRFNTIPHIISYRDTTTTVIVEGRKPLCWYCKQLEHFSRSCPQKATIATNKTTTTANDTMNTTTKTTTTTTTAAKKNINANTETGVQPDKEEGWTLVKGGKKKKTSPTKTTETITTITTKIAAAAPATTETPIKKKNKNQPEEMETPFNLKRRRDSGDSDKDGEKKQCTPKPKKQQPQIEKQKPQQPMPTQPQKPTEKNPRTITNHTE